MGTTWQTFLAAAGLTATALLVPPELSSVASHRGPVQDAAGDRTADEAVDRRNPRRIRRESGVPGPPRMEAGGIGVGSGDDIEPYDALEPLIGEFAMRGRQWRTPDSEDSSEFRGTWTNAWELDGYYMRSEFRIENMRPAYVAFGLTWWDSAEGRFEANFYNSRSTLRTHRFGRFDEEKKTLTMKSRHSRQTPDADPGTKYVIAILSDDSFTYTGYQFRDEETGWWKTFEITCTRAGTEAAEGGSSS